MSAERVTQALEHYREFLGDVPRVLVGFSGGLDSTVLLHAVLHSGIARPIALHVNHGLHGDAGRWEEHCARVCRELGVEHISTVAAVEVQGRGLEAAAREARYAWFEQQVEEGDCLLLAHHQDDQAETLLLRLLRGAGPDGLASMPVERALGRGRLLRPFLTLPRSDLAHYAQLHGLTWIDDPSNDDQHFDRNYLRGEILPLIETRWPAYRKVLSRTADLLREARDGRESLVLETCVSRTGDPGFACVDLPEDPAHAALAVRAWLRARSLDMPGQARLREFLRQLREGSGASLPMEAWTLTRFRDAVYAHKTSSLALEVTSLAVGQTRQCPGVGELALQPASAGSSKAGWRDHSTATPGELVVRGRNGRDRIARPSGHHQSLKTLFQELGVPPWWRDRVPLLVERHDDREELLGVGGFAIAPRLSELGLDFTWRPEPLG